MLRLTSASLREQSSLRVKARPFSQKKRFQHAIAVQLDYYMSPQFAGIASSLVNGTYTSKGLTNLNFLPICPVGLEQERVRLHQNANPTSVSIGTVEQNIFIPCLRRNPQLKTTAVAAMFATSPLCIASLPKKNEDSGSFIGTHHDTVDLMRKVFPDREVVASPRSTKTSDLLTGKVDAIQAYTTTEVLTLRHILGHEPEVVKMEGYNGTKLGYSQLMFVADESLQCNDRKEISRVFCEATFEGWANVIEKPEEAVEMVKEAKKMLNLDDEANDHWHDSDEFELEMVRKCSEYVKDTYTGEKYGVIDQDRWNEANEWLLNDSTSDFGLETSVWK